MGSERGHLSAAPRNCSQYHHYILILTDALLSLVLHFIRGNFSIILIHKFPSNLGYHQEPSKSDLEIQLVKFQLHNLNIVPSKLNPKTCSFVENLRKFQQHTLNSVSAKLNRKTCFFVENLRNQRLQKLDSAANSNRKTGSLSISPCCAIAIVEILKTG